MPGQTNLLPRACLPLAASRCLASKRQAKACSVPVVGNRSTTRRVPLERAPASASLSHLGAWLSSPKLRAGQQRRRRVPFGSRAEAALTTPPPPRIRPRFVWKADPASLGRSSAPSALTTIGRCCSPPACWKARKTPKPTRSSSLALMPRGSSLRLPCLPARRNRKESSADGVGGWRGGLSTPSPKPFSGEAHVLHPSRVFTCGDGLERPAKFFFKRRKYGIQDRYEEGKRPASSPRGTSPRSLAPAGSPGCCRFPWREVRKTLEGEQRRVLLAGGPLKQV